MRHRIATLFLASLTLTPVVTYGQSVTAVWDANQTSEQVSSYQVCIGTASLTCSVQLASVAGNQISYPFAPSGGVLHYVAVRAINSAGPGPYSTEATFSVPGFTQPSNQSSYVGVAITPLALSVTDPDGSTLAFTHTGLPVGLTLNPTTGQITGAATAAGTYNVTVFVEDNLVSVSRSFTWTVTSGAGAVSVSPSAGSGATQTFALQYSNVQGAINLSTARVRFGATESGVGSCTVSYNPSDGTARILDDAGVNWQTGTLGVGTLANSQCSVNLASSSASITGNNLTLSLAVTFTSAFAGAKNTYLLATAAGGSTGWNLLGTWTVPAGVPAVVSATPGSGTGASGTFTLQYSNSGGASYLSTARARFATSTAAAGNCSVAYRGTPGSLSILNDAGTTWQAGSIGSGTMANSQCSVNLSGSSLSISGNNLTMTLAVTFTPSFSGTKNIYMLADTTSASTGWLSQGTWTVPAGGPGVPSVTSVSPSSGSGASGNFVLQYSDTAGVADLVSAQVRFATTTSEVGSCTVSYDPSGNAASILNDAGTAWQAGTLGTGTLANSQCSVDLTASSASVNGNNLTLTLAVTFTSSFVGTQNIYMLAANASANTGWLAQGSWTVPSAPGVPSVVSVTPGSGSGASATFVLQYSDTAGVLDLATARVRFGTTSSIGAGTCTVSYDPSANTASILNDAATSSQVGTFGSGTLANSQCSVDLAASSASVNGNNLTLSLAITFDPSFTGPQITYMLAKTIDGTSTAWQQQGTWTAFPVGAAVINAISTTPNSGSGGTRTFVLQYSDSLGAMDLTSARVRFTESGGSASGSCTIRYNPQTQEVSLLDNAGAVWNPAVFGIGFLQNSQCAIFLGTSSASVSGNNLTLTLTVSFDTNGWDGAKEIYMLGRNAAGVTTGWQLRGSWTVP